MEFFDSMESFDSMDLVDHEAVVGEEETIPACSELIPATGELYFPRNIDFCPQVDSMNMVEHEAVVGEEETIPAYSELILATGPLYSPVNLDFHLQVQPTSPFVDRPFTPLWSFQDNNYDFSARGGHSSFKAIVRMIVKMMIVQKLQQKFLMRLGLLHVETLVSVKRANQICNVPLEVASGKVLEEAISVETTKIFGDNKLDSNHESPQGPQDYPNGGDMVQIDSSEQQPAVKRKNAKKISKRSLICNAPLEVASGKVLEEAISVETTKFSGDNKPDLNHESPQGPQDYPNGGDMVQIDSSEQQPAVERKNAKKISKRSLICNAPLEVASGKVLEEAISVETTKFSGDNKLDSNHESPQGPQDYPNGGDMVQIDSSEQQPAVEFDVRHNGGNIVIMGESDTPVAGSERKNAKKISKRKHRNTETLLSPELLQQLKGRMTLDEIAECTGASRTSVKRFCRKHKITTRWPRKRNESVQGAEGALYQPCLTKDPLNDAIGRPAKLNKSNRQNLSLAFQQMGLSPSARNCVSNTLASMQPQISAERMLTEVPECPEYLNFLHHSKKGKGVLESNETVHSCSNPTPEHNVASVAPTMPQVIAMQDVSTMTIKVRYRHDILKFPLSFSSGKRELEENISKRLELKLGTFRITYRDADGDWVRIYCDEDLQLCMGDSKRLGNGTIIMSVES